jgi:hypothetical protein
VSPDHPFDAARLAAMREEILTQGLVADRFLANDADCQTFGLNLACAWPFPGALRAAYEHMAKRLAACSPGLYVYPFAFTHVTLVTLISFSRHVRPSSELVKILAGKADEIIAALTPLFAGNSTERIKPFTLQPQAPVLSRSAGILPLLNPDGEVARLRQRVGELLQHNAPLHRRLVEHGLNVPGIIHSTVMRFRQPPPELNKFLPAFDKLAADTKFPAIQVGELLLTSETKPYMRGGEVLRQFKLSGA